MGLHHLMQMLGCADTVKPVYNGHSKKDQNLFFKTNYRLMQVKSVKLPFVSKIFVLSIFNWLFYIGFTVLLLFFFQTTSRIHWSSTQEPQDGLR